MIAYDPCPTKATETALLTSVLQLYSQGALPGGLQDINEEQVRLWRHSMAHKAYIPAAAGSEPLGHAALQSMQCRACVSLVLKAAWQHIYCPGHLDVSSTYRQTC